MKQAAENEREKINTMVEDDQMRDTDTEWAQIWHLK